MKNVALVVGGLGLDCVKLGKKVALRYVSFSELIVPWEVSVDPNVRLRPFVTELPRNNRDAKGAKLVGLEDMVNSIARFGLLRPLDVAEVPEKRVDFFYGKGKYVIIDGQRRYLALRELLKLPSEADEQKQISSLRTDGCRDLIVQRAEQQAQDQFVKLSVRDHVLVPCLVFPYTTYLQMLRHNAEECRLRVKSSKAFDGVIDKMRAQGIADVEPDDLNDLWEIRKRIDEERESIVKTLDQIRKGREKPNNVEGRVEAAV